MENITEKELLSKKEAVEKLYQEKKEGLEKIELSVKEERAIREKLEEEMVKIKLSPSLTNEVKKRAVQVKSLDEKERLEYLLDITKTNGVAFAVTVAQKMNDPYILDTFHDILAREGLYKKFKK
jgi:5-bromo-4-chloroindolyl phosphate hydrolysis protein